MPSSSSSPSMRPLNSAELNTYEPFPANRNAWLSSSSAIATTSDSNTNADGGDAQSSPSNSPPSPFLLTHSSRDVAASASHHSFSVLSYNIWGLFTAKDIHSRMKALAEEKLHHFDIVCLQENFEASDYSLILEGMNRAWSKKWAAERGERAQEEALAKGVNVEDDVGGGEINGCVDGSLRKKRGASNPIPRFKGIHSVSSFVGPGLSIITRFPIVSHNFYRFPLQGTPELVYHGDFFANKGVAVTRLMVSNNAFENAFDDDDDDAAEQFNGIALGGNGGDSSSDEKKKAPNTSSSFFSVSAANPSAAAKDKKNGKLPRQVTSSVVVYNSHFIGQYECYSKLKSYSREVNAAVRLSQAAFLADLIASTAAEDDNIIVCGDLNCAPESPEMALLSSILSQRSKQNRDRIEKEEEDDVSSTDDGSSHSTSCDDSDDDSNSKEDPSSPPPQRNSSSSGDGENAPKKQQTRLNKDEGDGDRHHDHRNQHHHILVRAVPADQQTNMTYTQENSNNSDPSGYLQIMSMLEDQPCQLDHILYRHSVAVKKKKSSKSKPISDHHCHHHNHHHENIDKLVMRPIPFLFGQSELTIRELLPEVSPHFTNGGEEGTRGEGNLSSLSSSAAVFSKSQGVVVFFETPQSNDGKPLSDHWGVACRFALVPMDASSSSSSSSPFSSRRRRRLLLEAHTLPRPNQCFSSAEYKLLAASLESHLEAKSERESKGQLTFSSSFPRLSELLPLRQKADVLLLSAMEESVRHATLKQLSATNTPALRERGGRRKGPGPTSMESSLLLDFVSSTSPPAVSVPVNVMVEGLLSHCDPLTYVFVQNGPEIFFHCHNRHVIIRMVNAILKAKVGQLARGQRKAMRAGGFFLALPAMMSFSSSFSSLFSTPVSGLLRSALSAGALVKRLVVGAHGVDASPSSSPLSLPSTPPSSSSRNTSFLPLVGSLCGIAGIVSILIGKLHREVDCLVLGNLTQSLDVLEGDVPSIGEVTTEEEEEEDNE